MDKNYSCEKKQKNPQAIEINNIISCCILFWKYSKVLVAIIANGKNVNTNISLHLLLEIKKITIPNKAAKANFL